MSVTTEKTTVTSSRKRGPMGASTVLVQSTPVGSRMSLGGGGGMTIRRSTNVVSSRSMGPGIVRPHGEAGKLSKDTLGTIAGSRDKEKREMSELNSKLAGYLENTRYLESTVKMLTDEIERLKKSKGFTQERVREEYREELEEARDALANIKNELAELQAKNLALMDKLESKDADLDAAKRQRDELKAELAKVANMVGDLEGELAANRRIVENAEREKNMLKEDVERLKADNDRIRNDCEAARCKQIEAQNERDALIEELQFEKDVYEQELAELRDLVEELRNVTPKIQDKWKSDFRDMIKVIQDDYNKRIEIMEDECRRRYEDQLIQIQHAQLRDNTDNITKTENKTLKSSLSQNKTRIGDLERENARLRTDLDDLRRRFDEECEDCENEKAKLRAENEDLQNEIQDVINSLQEMKSDNLTLTLEIACYRKLLEGEESKMARSIEQQGNIQSSGGAALAGIIGGSGGAQSSQSSS